MRMKGSRKVWVLRYKGKFVRDVLYQGQRYFKIALVSSPWLAVCRDTEKKMQDYKWNFIDLIRGWGTASGFSPKSINRNKEAGKILARSRAVCIRIRYDCSVVK